MAYTTIDNPELYFQTVTYTGNEVDDRAITLPGSEDMSPDMVWIKELLDDPHYLFDTVRGAAKPLFPARTAAETSDAPTLKSFTSDGFTVGTSAEVNDDGVINVAWCWKAGTTSGITTNGSTTITPATYSFSQTAGISILEYTGNATAGAKLAHGLGATPEFFVGKIVTPFSGDGWTYFHKTTGATDYLAHTNHATRAASSRWNNTAPDSVNITLGTDASVNQSDGTQVTYAFTGIQGYSKFGAYEGNGAADGTFVYTGFRPAFVMTKSIDSTSDWNMFDNKRAGYNVDNNSLHMNLEGTEATTDMIDILSNGFKCRIASDPNVAETYVYIAFAEQPFVNSNGVPCTAR